MTEPSEDRPRSYAALENENDELRAENNRLRADKKELVAALKILTGEINAIMRGEYGEDWADHFGPLFDMLLKSEAAIEKHGGEGEINGKRKNKILKELRVPSLERLKNRRNPIMDADVLCPANALDDYDLTEPPK